jgi:hypothetical protein
MGMNTNRYAMSRVETWDVCYDSGDTRDDERRHLGRGEGQNARPGNEEARRNKECVKGEGGKKNVQSSSCGKSDVIHRAVRRLRAMQWSGSNSTEQASSSPHTYAYVGL